MIVLLGIALVAISVWGLVFLRHCGLLGGALAVLAVGSCFGHPFYHTNVGPLPITADRLVLGVLLVVYLAFRLLPSRFPRRVDRRAFDQLDVAMILLIGMMAFATFAHDWRAEGFRAAASLLFFYLLPATLYLIVREARIDTRGVTYLFGALAVFGGYLAVTAILEQQQVWSLVFPRYIVSAEHAEFLGRGRGPYLNPVANGLFMCAGFFSLLMFWPRVGWTGKLLLLAAAAIYLAGVYCTLTRVVWLAAFAGLLAILVLSLPRRWSVAVVVSTAVLASVVMVTRWEDLNAFKRDRHVSVAEMSESASLRPILAYVAWQMYLDRPLVGCGYRQYDAAVNHYLSDRATRLRLERVRLYSQHNVFLALLAETGTIGLGLFLLLLAVLSHVAWRLWSAAQLDLASRQLGLVTMLVVMSYVGMGLFHDMSLIPMTHMLIFCMAGVSRSVYGQFCESAALPGRGFSTKLALPEGCGLKHAV